MMHQTSVSFCRGLQSKVQPSDCVSINGSVAGGMQSKRIMRAPSFSLMASWRFLWWGSAQQTVLSAQTHWSLIDSKSPRRSVIKKMYRLEILIFFTVK